MSDEFKEYRAPTLDELSALNLSISEKVNKRKESSDLISLAVHDARGPLTLLRGYLEFVEPEISDALRRPADQIGQIYHGINDRAPGTLGDLIITQPSSERNSAITKQLVIKRMGYEDENFDPNEYESKLIQRLSDLEGDAYQLTCEEILTYFNDIDSVILTADKNSVTNEPVYINDLGKPSIITNKIVWDNLISGAKRFRQAVEETKGVLTEPNLPLHKTDVDVSKFIPDLIKKFQPQSNTVPHPLILEYPSDTLFVYTDVTKVESIILNLLENADKYSPKESAEPIHVSVSQQGDSLIVNVTDRGIGLSQEDLNQLFNPGYRTNKGKKHTSGTGYGLWKSQRYAKRLGGQITASSPGPGQGSTFTLSIPIRG